MKLFVKRMFMETILFFTGFIFFSWIIWLIFFDNDLDSDDDFWLWLFIWLWFFSDDEDCK